MFGIERFWELLLILAIALLFFGPKRLPEMGNAFGKTIREFQRSMREGARQDNATEHQLPPPSAVDAPHSETSSH